MKRLLCAIIAIAAMTLGMMQPAEAANFRYLKCDPSTTGVLAADGTDAGKLMIDLNGFDFSKLQTLDVGLYQ
jgi:hypothetical protein